MNARRRRQREIADVLVRHGLGYLVDVAGLSRVVPFERGLLGHEQRAERYTQAEHVRLALEELGTTFIKLGQVLSTRADLLPAEYRAELSKLQDAAPPVEAGAIREVVADELGDDVWDAFSTFDLEPVAAASIGQAHAATLADGTEVIVKVRRPGVVAQVQQDLEILENLAATAERRWAPATGHDVVGIADEFARTLRAELDYLQEGRNAEQFSENFAGDPDVRIPRVFWDTTTSRIITLERIRGIKITAVDELDAAGIDRRALAERATRVTAKMIFEDGFFHADPHPGNFFVQPGGRLGIIDFGMVGTVDDGLRDRLATLLVALAREDADGVAGALVALGLSTGPIDRASLKDDVTQLLGRYAGRPVGDIEFGAAVADVLSVARRHRLRLPRDLMLLLKMIVMDEGMAAQLDPEFRLGVVLTPYARRLIAGRFSPEALLHRLGKAGVDTAHAAADLPDVLRRVVDVLADDGLEVHLRADELEQLVARAERLGDRLIAGVLAAAFIDGLAGLLATDEARWRPLKRPMVAIGFGAAGAFAAYAARRHAPNP